MSRVLGFFLFFSKFFHLCFSLTNFFYLLLGSSTVQWRDGLIDRGRRENRAQMTRCVLFGPQVCYMFPFFIYLTKFLFVLGTSTNDKWLRRVMGMTKNGEQGQNDTSRVI